jgi:hypothetical protein
MIAKRQFSLRYLLAEVLLFALALAFTRMFFLSLNLDSDMGVTMRLMGLGAGLSCWGAAIGGLFGRMGVGVMSVWGLFLVWLVFFAPSVQ